MNDTAQFGLPGAASRLGVSLPALRHAIRTGKIPAPANMAATVAVSAEWFAGVLAAIQASPNALNWRRPQKVPPFARYKGTSAWHKYRVRVRAYAQFRAAANEVKAA